MSTPDLPQLRPPHYRALQRAFVLLENHNFATRLANYAGQPVDRVLRLLPPRTSRRLHRMIEAAILRCLTTAIQSIGPNATTPPATTASSMLAGLTGAASGFFGIAALPIELPITTTLMLRAIADMARHFGEDLNTIDARLACIEVFGLGTTNVRGRTDVGYYASRALLSRLAGDVSSLLLERGVAGASAPMVSGLVTEVASRFGVVVSERAAASALPVLGALGGATINVIFMDHFQRIALAHFTIRSLERRYGAEAIRGHYDALLLHDAPRELVPAAGAAQT
jgi:hypothetical protein